MGAVAGVDNVTMTSVRRSMEPIVQGNAAMKLRSKSVANHSSQVGARFYDRMNSDFRASSMTYIAAQEQSNVAPVSESSLSAVTRAKRKQIEEEDNKAKLENAKKILKTYQAAGRKTSTGARCKVTSDNREYLQSSFTSGGRYSHILTGFAKFPPVKTFKKSFYRLVDSFDDDDDSEASKMRQVEHEIFKAVKSDIEKKMDREWDGSFEMNKVGDQRVAEAIVTSFKVYENSKGKQQQFFNFK